MSNPEPSIRVGVDVTNPGQFFACCGLLELADRLWRGAEGWFENRAFCIACDGTLLNLLGELAAAQINSSLSDQELQRLGTLLSAEKASLTPTELEEKQHLRDMWQRERLHLSKPFDLWIDWWLDDQTGAAGLKTWAAKQLVIDIARPLLQSLRSLRWDEGVLPNCLQRTAKVEGLPFYFDSDSNSQNTPRDTGFGLFTLRQVVKSGDSTRPLLELAAFLGLQRFRPKQVGREKLFRFGLWTTPLPVTVAKVAITGLLGVPQERFEFRMLYRSQYMKAFLPARLSQGD